MKTTPCRGCGKPIVFASLSDGKLIPLDPRPPVYEAVEFMPGPGGTVEMSEHRTPVRVERHFTAYVTHFATCPKAGDFSAGKKK